MVDIENLEVTLARLIVPYLKKYRTAAKRRKYVGYPMNFAQDDDGFELWISVLDKMIYSFEYIAKYEGYINKRDKRWCGFNKQIEQKLKEHAAELNQLSKENPMVEGTSYVAFNESPYDKRRLELIEPIYRIQFKYEQAVYERIQIGLDLFGKYFRDLNF